MERKQAAAAGFIKYNTGRQCRHGHLADRYVNSGACVDCLKLQQSKFVQERKAATLSVSPRKLAASLGNRKYRTTTPCKNGHLAERYVDSGACVECVKKSTSAIYASNADTRATIDTCTRQIFLFSKQSGYSAIKMMVDDLIAKRLPALSPDAVNPLPFWEKRESRGTYKIKVRVPNDDVQLAYAMGDLLREREEKLA